MKKVSIIITAYNKLEYSKLLLKSLYDNTKNIEYELITVNDGSTDGTETFFNSLANTKKVNLKYNVGLDKAFNTGLAMADGKYVVFINNDIIVSNNWLTNLLKVIESDEKIGVVVPATNYSSNYQAVNLQYRSYREFQVKASEYNKSDNSKWEERLRLVTYLAIFRTKELKNFEGFDVRYSPGGFEDDDITCQYRRNGYKIILARDTFVHHFGSITIGNQYKDILNRNRREFINKFGYDSWIANEIDFKVVDEVGKIISRGGRFIGIGNDCGATLLQIKNKLKEKGIKDIILDYYCCCKNFYLELMTICQNVIYGEIENILNKIDIKKYDLIYIKWIDREKKISSEIIEEIKKQSKESAIVIY